MAARRKANAKLLSDLLQDIGYHKKLSPSGLEWAFEHPETRDLLEWLVQQDLRRQVLSKEELEQYEQLVDSGKVLRDKELDAEFHRAVAAEQLGEGGAESAGAEGPDAEDPLDLIWCSAFQEAEQSALEEEHRDMEADRAALLRQRQAVRRQLEAVRRRSAPASARAAAADEDLSAATLSCASVAADVDHALDSLRDNGKELCNELLKGKDSPAGSDSLLCTLPLDSYVRADLAYSQALERVRPKEAQEGKGAAAEPPGLSHGRDAMQKEISRMRNAFEVSERERVLATAAEAEAEAELAAVQSFEASRRLEDAPVEGISAEAAGAQARAAQLEVQRQGLVRDIEGLLAKASSKQDLRVLKEDYRRKIERQELLIDQRKEYLRLLLKQAAWHKVLEAALAMEAEQLNSIQDLLSAAEVDVASLADGCEARRRGYNVPQDLSGSRLTIRSGDHVLQDLAAVLGVSQQRSDVLTGREEEGEAAAAAAGYVEVVKLKEKVKEMWSASIQPDRAPEEELRSLQETELSSTHASVTALNHAVFGSPSGLEPVMAPAALPEAIRALKGVNGALLKAADGVASRYAAKAEQVTSQGHAGVVARNVFCWFHTDRERLVHEVAKIEAEME